MLLRDRDYELAVKLGIIDENAKSKYQCVEEAYK